MAWGAAEYGLILNGAAVLANGFCAWWLKDYVKQKEELKDTEISNIRSIMQAKDAYIDNLNRLAAPALSEYVTSMRDSLNSMAQDLLTYKKKVAELERSHEEAGNKEQEWQVEKALLTRLNDRLSEYVDMLKDRTNELTKTGFLSALAAQSPSVPLTSLLDNSIDGVYRPPTGGFSPGPIDSTKPNPINRRIGTDQEKPHEGVTDLLEKKKKPKGFSI